MLHFYPYLRGPFNYDCADDPWEAGKAPYSPGHDGAGDSYKEDTWWQQQNHEQMESQFAEQLARVAEQYQQT